MIKTPSLKIAVISHDSEMFDRLIDGGSQLSQLFAGPHDQNELCPVDVSVTDTAYEITVQRLFRRNIVEK